MTSQRDETKEPLMGDGGRNEFVLNPEDKHFTIVNERGDHNSNAHAATQALLAQESGNRSPSAHGETLPQTSSGISADEILDKSDQDIGNKRKRTESPDSEIVVIDDNGERESIGSGLESDIEDNDTDAGESVARHIAKEYDPCIDDNLPETVTLLTVPCGSKLYLVGTAHFSLESQNDVAKIIQAVQPNIVMVELCTARVHILQLDEKTILQEAQKLSFENIRKTIQQNGLSNGLMYILLLNMSAYLTKELGMAPGGEFRRAFAEAKQVPNCLVHMGDRPINITIQRALSSLSWWQTFKLGWHLLTSNGPISREEVERCKRRDLLEEMLAEMTGEFPALSEVFVKERDLYLTHSLQLACLPQRTATGVTPVRVVGVVGIGHVSGIVQHWGKVKTSDIPPILRIPPPSLSSKVLRFTVKASFVGVIIFIGYKIIPLPSGETIQSLKSSVEGLWKEKVSGPVVECNTHCKCDNNCGNRLVQYGPLDCLVITPTELKGYGLRTSRPIKKGQFICEYAGEVIGIEEAKRRIESNKIENSMNYVLILSEHLNDERIIKTCIDPKHFGNVGRYCNHSCEPNAGLVPVRIEGMVPRLCLFASRDIKEGEEITFNYAGEEANSVHNLSETPCLCGSSKCVRYLPHNPV